MPLSKNDKCPFFVQLYSLKGCIAGQVSVDTAGVATDAQALDCRWCRPAQATSQWYPEGWPAGILVDLLGSRYVIPTGLPAQSVIPGLGTLAPNGILSFSKGEIVGTIDKDVNVSTANVATKAVTTDASFTFGLTKSTGEISGSLTVGGKKSTYQAATFQKAGAHQGTWGFFMTAAPKPLTYLGESGVVKMSARE